ncbi:MAG: hypothetical protein WC390_07195 [Sulfurimonas sp.]|jgi:3D (Asp-Asp-Asp) domain-containing protein
MNLYDKHGKVNRKQSFKLTYFAFFLGIIIATLVCYFFKKDEVKPKNTPVIQNKAKFDTLQVKISTYKALKSQTDEMPYLTSSGFKINPKTIYKDKTIAVSQDLLNRINYNDTIEVFGTFIFDGKFIVRDCLNKRIKNTVDILINSNEIGGCMNGKILIKRK